MIRLKWNLYNGALIYSKNIFHFLTLQTFKLPKRAAKNAKNMTSFPNGQCHVWWGSVSTLLRVAYRTKWVIHYSGAEHCHTKCCPTHSALCRQCLVCLANIAQHNIHPLHLPLPGAMFSVESEDCAWQCLVWLASIAHHNDVHTLHKTLCQAMFSWALPNTMMFTSYTKHCAGQCLVWLANIAQHNDVHPLDWTLCWAMFCVAGDAMFIMYNVNRKAQCSPATLNIVPGNV